MFKQEYQTCWILIIFSASFSSVLGQYCQPGKTYIDCTKYDLAYNRWTTQSKHHFGAALAVDGNYSTCSSTTHVDNPYLHVDLGKNVKVHSLYVYMGQTTLNVMRAYVVEVQKDLSSEWKVCYNWTGNAASSPLYIVCPSDFVGRHVRFTIPQNQIDLQLCNVGVIGECVNGTYGNYCDNKCTNCLPVTWQYLCNRVTGECTSGCDDGFTSLTCSQSCPNGTYGAKCSKQCGECYFPQTCNQFTGECPQYRCKPGYKKPFCQEACDDGTYGENCIECGNCNETTVCNRTNGHCPDGCADGFKPTDEFCRTECPDMTWGPSCIRSCGSCYQEGSYTPGPCNKTTGECEMGCAPGYQQTSNFDCFNRCPEGTWGVDCDGQCSNNCRDLNNDTQVNCSTVDGSCLRCMPGWQGLLCKDICSPGSYGEDCSKTCGQCKNPCDHLTGLCNGDCKDGYLGEMCTQACSSGRYGYKCQQVCPPNCVNNTCDVADGSCVCKDGWTGPKCTDPCPTNHYGKNCESVCGNCREGTTCNQHDGYCPDGCKEDWNGLKCDAKKITEVYKRSYGDVIGGSIAGVIALALITTFVVWVVWRYRKDKSIHIRELAASLRRMSLRGSQRIRRSLQRLSFRSKKNQDQQKLEKDAEKPGTATGHSHRGKASVPRMYECVRLQSNVIHYDDFPRLYLQLQETKSGGQTLLYDSFQSFLAQRPTDHSVEQNGTANGSAYYNAANLDDIQVEVSKDKQNVPAFLPLGSNLSGFLLINAPATSEMLWNHLRQRQIENIISVGKEASFAWTPGESVKIGYDIITCVETQLYASHRESKLTVQTKGIPGRRAVRHLECFFWSKTDKYATIPTLLMFLDRFQQLHARQRERSVLVNYINLHDQAIMLTLVASCLEIIRECKRVDILRTVATGGNANAKAVRTFEEFKYLHDVVFQYVASSDGSTSI